VNRFAAFLTDALDALVPSGAASWVPRALIVGGVLVLAGVGTVVAMSLIGMGPIGLSAGPDARTDEPSPVASPESPGTSADPSGGVAESRRLVADFDLLATGSPIGGWTLTDGATLVTAARPTALDRSARLDGDGVRTACQDLDVELGQLTATFMIDRLPDGDVTLLALAVDDGSTHRLTVIDGEATASPDSKPVALEAGRWYRWAVASGDDGVRVGLVDDEGAVLTEATSGGATPEARATAFCMTAGTSTRLYLSDLTVETR
jgi:hypothetical protein